jgi:hypothetical protein
MSTRTHNRIHKILKSIEKIKKTKIYLIRNLEYTMIVSYYYRTRFIGCNYSHEGTKGKNGVLECWSAGRFPILQYSNTLILHFSPS